MALLIKLAPRDLATDQAGAATVLRWRRATALFLANLIDGQSSDARDYAEHGMRSIPGQSQPIGGFPRANPRGRRVVDRKLVGQLAAPAFGGLLLLGGHTRAVVHHAFTG